MAEGRIACKHRKDRIMTNNEGNMDTKMDRSDKTVSEVVVDRSGAAEQQELVKPRRAVVKVLVRLVAIVLVLAAIAAAGLGYLYMQQDRTWYAECADAAGIEAHCDFTNPEDFEFLADGSMLVSQYEAGAPLLRYYPEEGHRQPLALRGELAGGGKCADFDFAAMQTLGIALMPQHPRNSASAQVFAATNHNPTQVNVFALEGDMVDHLACYSPPVDYFLNDLAPDGSGGLFVSAMFERALGGRVALSLLTQEDTGMAWHLSRNGDWTPLPDTSGVLPNGVAYFEEHLWVAYSGSNYVSRFHVKPHDLLTTFAEKWEMDVPDNITHLGAGMMAIASQDSHWRGLLQCNQAQQGICGKPSTAYLLQSGAKKPLILHRYEGPPMGSVSSVGLHDGLLWAGTNAGDRLTAVKPQRSSN